MFWHEIVKKFGIPRILKACLEENKQLHKENRLLKKMFKNQGTLLHEQQQFMELEMNKIREVSLTDELTGAFNRRYLHNVEVLFHGQERNNKFIGVSFIDLDNFKIANDTCGHDVGDEILIRVASIFQELVRESDVVARIGGDEFLIVSTNVTNKESLLALSARLHGAVKEMQIEDCNILITLSIGVCFVGKTEGKMNHNLNEAMGLADKAMYISKKRGRNQTTLISKLEDLKEL